MLADFMLPGFRPGYLYHFTHTPLQNKAPAPSNKENLHGMENEVLVLYTLPLFKITKVSHQQAHKGLLYRKR